jgi:hypothetical protein
VKQAFADHWSRSAGAAAGPKPTCWLTALMHALRGDCVAKVAPTARRILAIGENTIEGTTDVPFRQERFRF